MLLYVQFHNGIKEVEIHFQEEVIDGDFLEYEGCLVSFDKLFALEWEIEEDYNYNISHEIGDDVTDEEFVQYLRRV